MEDEDLQIVANYEYDIQDGFTSWENESKPESIAMIERNCSNFAFDARRPRRSGVAKLFLLGGMLEYGSPYIKIGLAPSTAWPGDFVCQIHGLERAVVVRYGTLVEVGSSLGAV